jgi:hypothetical protein
MTSAEEVVFLIFVEPIKQVKKINPALILKG